MNQQDSFENAFRQARELHKAGRLDEAERAYMALAQPGAERRELVLQALAELYMQTRRVGQLVDAMVALTEEAPDNFTYSAQLATLLDRLGHTEAAIDEYHRLISRQPDHAVAQFNLALLYKRALRYRDALSAYEEALRLGIDRLSEVYSNMGVVCTEMRDPVRARKMYEQALEHDSAYIPALFNLAGLHEEAGDRDEATRLYEKILNLDPAHGEALARLAYAAGSESESEQLVARLTAATGEPGDATLTREGLYFALGKLHDQLGAYEQAANAYTEANALGKSRLPPYQRDSIESSIGELMDLYDKEWIEQFAGESDASPVFVCGMFRSGSTLVERMLGAHSAITAGGELDFLPWLIAHRLAPYPQKMREVSPSVLQELGSEYLQRVADLFPAAGIVTDKRPDNFLHLGLIRTLFPKARIVYTRRNAVDNCLSIFFQQLGGNLNYATDLSDVAHYHAQHLRLMAHWQDILGDNIFSVDYDDLVQSPEPQLRGLLEFLGLEWDERCLSFDSSGGSVRTASIWQVRDRLHTASSGRWRNYAPHLPALTSLFDLDAIPGSEDDGHPA